MDLACSVVRFHVQAPVKTSIQEGVLPDCPLFHNRPHFPMSGMLTLNMALSILHALPGRALDTFGTGINSHKCWLNFFLNVVQILLSSSCSTLPPVSLRQR